PGTAPGSARSCAPAARRRPGPAAGSRRSDRRADIGGPRAPPQPIPSPIRARLAAALRSTAMEQALAAFRQFLTAEKRASEHTVRAYLHDLDEFRAHAEAALGRPPALDELDVILCRSYL